MFDAKLDVKYVDHMGTDLTIVNSARISMHKRSDKLSDKDEHLIDFLAKNQHMTPFEHNTLTVIVECPLYIRSQIHRHRTFSYNEISRRYTSDWIEFYIPEKLGKQDKSNKQGTSGEFSEDDEKMLLHVIKQHSLGSMRVYELLLDEGVSKEIARVVLPVNLMTKFYMTGNLRNWMHFIGLRLDPHAQLESRMIAQKVLDILMLKFPVATTVLKKYMVDK